MIFQPRRQTSQAVLHANRGQIGLLFDRLPFSNSRLYFRLYPAASVSTTICNTHIRTIKPIVRDIDCLRFVFVVCSSVLLCFHFVECTNLPLFGSQMFSIQPPRAARRGFGDLYDKCCEGRILVLQS